jgi:hypothetical protein
MKKTGYDINKIIGNGTLILPISMSRISSGQTPEDCYDMLSYFRDKLASFNNDAILMYTNGLYFNTEDIAYEKRKKTNAQIIDHTNKMRDLINTRREFIPKAIHFMPIDYVILNSATYQIMFSMLKKREVDDEHFRNFIKADINGRDYSEAHINFILEEIVVGHLIREQFVDLPVTLAKQDEWRLICYPGIFLRSEVYSHQQNLLEKNPNCTNEFRGTMYDFKDHILHVFSDIDLAK